MGSYKEDLGHYVLIGGNFPHFPLFYAFQGEYLVQNLICSAQKNNPGYAPDLKAIGAEQKYVQFIYLKTNAAVIVTYKSKNFQSFFLNGS